MAKNVSNKLVVQETATINWTIIGFENVTNYIYSPFFFAPSRTDQFLLTLRTKAKFFTTEDVFISLNYNEDKKELALQYRVSIVNSNGDKLYTQEYRWNYYKNTNNKYNQRNFTNFLPYNECVQFLVNGNLHILCEVDVLENKQITFKKSLSNKSVTEDEDGNGTVTKLQMDFENLFENCEFTDVVLLVKDVEFKAHKAILASRSKVFKAMFTSDLQENRQNRVQITDIEVDVFERVLGYIYSGKILAMRDYALDYLVVADKYQLDHLRSISARYLSSCLITESVVKVLVIADMHEATELKCKCIHFIKQNLAAVKATDGWKQIQLRPHLFKQVCGNVTE